MSTVKYFGSIKKEEIPAIFDNMGGSQRHYAK